MDTTFGDRDPASVRAVPARRRFLVRHLVEPARTRLLAGLEPDRVVEIRGGHGLHRDRPALFLLALLDLTRAR